MNAVLHNKATIKIMAGNTFSDPQFIKNEDVSELERFDYIVANPPFSLKNWSDGLKEFGRFSGYGDRPPEKNGDYAWLMHILKTLLKKLDSSVSAKILISELAENIMKAFEDITLINKYDIYQILLAYWNEVLNDDVSLIISDDKGYEIARETENIMKETKKTDADGNPELKAVGWEGKLIPKEIVISELFPEEKKAIDDLMDIVAETDSRLMAMIEESAEDSALSELAEGGKVKSKDIQEKIDKIMENVHTPLIDSLVTLLNLLTSMKKKEYTQYIDKHAELKVAYTDKGTVTKASINNALSAARAEAPAPAAYADDYDELKKAFELAQRSEESTKLIKEMDKALDEKARERYASLTDVEIKELLVDKKWYYAIGKGIIDLYTAISHKLAERITELSKRYELTLTDLDSQILIRVCRITVCSKPFAVLTDWMVIQRNLDILLIISSFSEI